MPITIADMAGPRNPSICRSGLSSIAFIVGTIVMWLQNTEKFAMPSRSACSTVSAVDGMVVSKPRAKNTTSRSGFLPRERQRVHRRIDHAHVGAFGLRLQQAFLRPGTRIASPNVARLPPASRRSRGNRRFAPSAARRPGIRGRAPVRSLGQHAFDPIAEYRMGMAAADFHDVQRALRRLDRDQTSISAVSAGLLHGRGIRRRISCRTPVRRRAAIIRQAGCAPNPTEYDRRRRGIPGCGGSSPRAR